MPYSDPEIARAKRHEYDVSPRGKAKKAAFAKTEKFKASQLRWRQANPEKVKRSQANWNNAHSENLAAAKRRHTSKKRARLNILKDAPCCDCGGRFPPECMDFDHVRGDKVRDVGLLVQCSPVRLDAEIEKCELVCANCHRIRTKKRRDPELVAELRNLLDTPQ